MGHFGLNKEECTSEVADVDLEEFSSNSRSASLQPCTITSDAHMAEAEDLSDGERFVTALLKS